MPPQALELRRAIRLMRLIESGEALGQHMKPNALARNIKVLRQMGFVMAVSASGPKPRYELTETGKKALNLLEQVMALAPAPRSDA